ncbi:hypothetical protein VTO73DRAFT_15278 [Trametes versicolor]
MPKEPTARPRRSTAGPTGELADHSYLHEPTWKTDTPRMRLIWKALAKSKYRLDDSDLKGYVHDRDFDDSDKMIVQYRERIVQHVAWELYDGPTGFWRKLKTELDEHVAEYGNKEGFRYPHDYRPGGRYDLDGDPPPYQPRRAPVPDRAESPAPLRPDPYVGDSMVLAGAKQLLPGWLWTACNKQLDAEHGPPTQPGANLQVREELMGAFMQPSYGNYPARPDDDIRWSLVNFGLDKVLSVAPCAPQKGSEGWGLPVPDLEFVQVPGTRDGYYEWNGEYLEKVFEQIHDLASRYGLGECDGGWQVVRWKVYDEYVECLRRGPRYDPVTNQWVDDAKFWLDEHQYEVGTAELRATLRDRCAAGLRFNALLPVHPPIVAA